MSQENNINLSENRSNQSDTEGRANFITCEGEVEISSTVDDQGLKSESESCNDKKTRLRMVPKRKVYMRKRVKSPVKNNFTNVKTTKKKRSKKAKTEQERLQYDGNYNSENAEMPQHINVKDNIIGDSHVSTTQETSEYIEEDNSVAETNIKLPLNKQMKKKYGSKRGRPKKQLAPDNVSQPVNIENLDIESSSSSKQNIKQKRGGRPRKTELKPETPNNCTVSRKKTTQNKVNVKTVSQSIVNETPQKQIFPVSETSDVLSKELKLESCTLKLKEVGNKPQKSERKKNKIAANKNHNQEEFATSTRNKLSDENQSSFENASITKLSEIKEKVLSNECDTIDVINVSNENIDEDETDDICLSKLKEKLETCDKNESASTLSVEKELILPATNMADDSKAHSTKRHSRMPIMSDFEYNIDSIVTDSLNNSKSEIEKNSVNNEQPTTSFAAESSSGRSLRRKGKQILLYDEGSDEDPFANVELSDDDGDPRRSKKGKRYFSDDEYIPGIKRGRVSTSDTADSDFDKKEDGYKKNRKKMLNTKSPKKRGKKRDVDATRGNTFQSLSLNECNGQDEDNVKICSETSAVSIDDDTVSEITQTVNSSDEIETFLAKKIQGTNLKIKRVSNVEPRALTSLEIPTIEHNTKKKVEIASQTHITKTKTASVQTITSYDLPMKTNVNLSDEQAENACAFLKTIVKTTSELGELLTQKSEEFIQKKINTKYVTDTFKMDNCIQKSFLLFKLAKQNLMQMEEDLCQQYDNFLSENDMMQYREQPKSIIPTTMVSDDSDCEIVEESLDTDIEKTKSKSKSEFNLKTVFLNKELSIKIAKKPSEEQNVKDKINIIGQNPVWISDSVLVKKVA